MFIRRKIVNGVTYYAVVESRRVGGKVRQYILASLGRCATIREALAIERRELDYWQRLASCPRTPRLCPECPCPAGPDHDAPCWLWHPAPYSKRRVTKLQKRIRVLEKIAWCQINVAKSRYSFDTTRAATAGVTP